jgi:hypothetical protein
MGKRSRKKKSSSSLTWKAVKGLFRLLTQGIVKGTPFALVALIGFAIFWAIREELYADPGLQIQAIEVVPHGSLSEARLKELQKRYFGRNLLRVSVKEVARFIEEDPKIREARVTRELPKALRVEIKERVPFAQLQFAPKGSYFSVAEDAVFLDEGEGRNKNLLLVELFEVPDPEPRKGKRLPLPGFEEGVKVARAFWGHPISKSETLEKLRLDRLGNVALVLKDGPELRLGRDPMGKFFLLESVNSLLKGPERRSIIYMELQYNDIVVKKK